MVVKNNCCSKVILVVFYNDWMGFSIYLTGTEAENSFFMSDLAYNSLLT